MEHKDEGNGYMWRKYGEKSIGGARKHAIRRSYYRCVCFRSSAPCAAKKRVDRLLSEDADNTSTPPVAVVYINHHSNEVDGSPCQRQDGQGDGQSAEGFAGMMRELEHMRSEDLAREMVSDLMLQLPEGGGWGGAPGAHPGAGAGSLGPDTSGDTSMELCASVNEALASEAEELLSALLEGPRACAMLPARSPEAQFPRGAISPQSFHQQHMDALAFLNQGRMVSRAPALEVAPGAAPYGFGSPRSGHTQRPLGGGAWMPSAPMPIRPQAHHLPGSNSSSSSNRGNDHASRGQGWRALQRSPEAEASNFVSTEDAEYLLECLRRGLQAGIV